MFGGAYGDARMPNWSHWHRTPLPRIATTGLCQDKGGNALGQTTFLSHFSSATQVCGWCDYTLPSFRDQSGSQDSGLDGKLAAGCLQSGPTWIVFCFRCWITDGKNGGGMARSGIGCWVVAAMGAPAAPVLSPSCAHCQSDKSGHLIPSFYAFQYNRDQTVRRKRRFAHLF